MLIGNIISGPLAEQLETVKEEKKNPLREKTIESIKASSVLFQGSRKKSVPQKFFTAFQQLYEAYQPAICQLQEMEGFALPIDLAYRIHKSKKHHGYFHTFPDGRFIYYHRRNSKLRISLYHDYGKDMDLFRITLALKERPAVDTPVKYETYTIPANDDLRAFFRQCEQRRQQQLASREHREYLAPVHSSFVAFDLERTSRMKDEPPEADKIIEIGAVRVTEGKITDSFEQLVNPHRSIMSRAAKITGIKNSMLKGQPDIEEALDRFLRFIDDSVLIGHSIDDNDLPPIRQLTKKFGIPFRNRHYDTLRLAEILTPSCGFEHLNLEYLSQKLGVEPERVHRAKDDAETTALVYLKLRELYYAANKKAPVTK